MAELTIERHPFERASFEEEYELLVRDLEEQGHHVSVREAIEARDATGGLDAVGWGALIYLATHVAEEVIDAIVAAALRRLSGPGRFGAKRERRVVIYGPDERVLREVEIPDE